MNDRKVLSIAVPILLFAVLAISIRQGTSSGFENWAYGETTERLSPCLTAVMKTVTLLGDPTVVTGFCLFLFLFPKTRVKAAVPVSLSVLLSAALNLTLKNIFARSRPNVPQMVAEAGYSFPSGHTMVSTALYVTLIFLINRGVKSRPRKIFLSALCILLMLGIGCSRVYLGVHYAGDVIGGWLIGFAVSAALFSVWSRG